MKLVINYDFFNAVRNVNEPLTPMKIVRNHKIKYSMLTPAWLILGSLEGYGQEYLIQKLVFLYGFYMATDCMFDILTKKKLDNIDIYAYRASLELKKLPNMLGDINVKTTYDMLLRSELYKKQYKIERSKDKSIALTEKKYIYVPSYGFDGQEKETSILQEHDIGSVIYTLSVGEPEKQYRRVLVNNQA